ncbi:TRAP transporter large permease [Halobacillus amylolyticus]|uniref:TRAP transporter large permease n=1 Tax=Halobacillus amylolyticus TaxID=2932259 RepID=A0ABY4H914_9BACI|nr:TRAP transporter large permease [Halobacillus amylolyticus]UOR11364.1 TRAP transporter large permease [Halobacillus amylolyticus]
MIIFLILGLLLIMGLPVSFAIGLSCLVFIFTQDITVTASIISQRMISGVDSFPLLALPFFLLAGNLMVYGTTPRLMSFANALLGFIKGGLAGVSVVASAFFGAISGSGVATVAAIGSVVTPEMIKKGYGRGFVAPLIAGAGVLGMVIPPSMAMVVFGVSSGVSIGDLFLAGIIPGLLVSVFLIVFGIVISNKRNYGGDAEQFDPKELAVSFKSAILPLLLPIIILGGVMSGIFTPTESAVVAVVYALILATVVYRELPIKKLFSVIKESAVNSSIILFIIAAATPFGWILTTQQIPNQIANVITNATSSGFVILLLISLILLVMGTFMETIATIIIMTPILFPIAMQAGIEPLHFGVIMMVNLAIGGVTPPLAVGLFISAKIADISVEKTFPDVLYVLLVMILSYAVIVLVPALSLWIPSHF